MLRDRVGVGELPPVRVRVHTDNGTRASSEVTFTKGQTGVMTAPVDTTLFHDMLVELQ